MTAVLNKVSNLDTARERLEQMRDELKLKAHLAKADAREEWERLETKWHQFEARVRASRRDTDEAMDTVWNDVKHLADEIKEGYERLRKAL